MEVFINYLIYIRKKLLSNTNASLTGTGTGIPYWDFVGSTIITNKFIRLTSESQSNYFPSFNININLFIFLN
jgi:hypothetical protein